MSVSFEGDKELSFFEKEKTNVSQDPSSPSPVPPPSPRSHTSRHRPRPSSRLQRIWHVYIVNIFVLGLSVLLSLLAAVPLALNSLGKFTEEREGGWGVPELDEVQNITMWAWLGYAYCFGFNLQFMIFESKER